MLTRERVKRIINERGMTQTTLARRMNEEVDWINTRLTGRVQIKADELPKIAAALRVSTCALVDDEALEKTLHGESGYRPAETDAALPGSPTDIGAERLYRLYRQVWGDNPQDVEAYLEFLDWKRSRGK